MKKINNSKKLKLRFKFNDNISKEEEDRIWFQLFDILLNKDDEGLKNKTIKSNNEL